MTTDTLTPEEFGLRLESYFGRRYNQEQRTQIKRWSERHCGRTLLLVYQSVVAEDEFPPLVRRLKAHAEGVYEGFPELDPDSYNRQMAEAGRQITDDAGWTDEDRERALAQLREIVSGAAAARRLT